MNISLVIPAYNEEKYLAGCLLSIQRYGQDLHEVIVVSNGSTDRTVEIAQSFPFVRVVVEPKKGLPQARQRGLNEATNDIVAFIDADTRLPKKWVSKIHKSFSSNQKLVCLSGPYVYYEASLFSKILTWGYWFIFGWPAYLVTGYMATGGNLVVRKKVFQSVGGFDQNIEFYGDDTDVARRLNSVGQTVFRQSFYVYSSARRFMNDGIIYTVFHYLINFLAIVVLKRPITVKHKDIR